MRDAEKHSIAKDAEKRGFFKKGPKGLTRWLPVGHTQRLSSSHIILGAESEAAFTENKCGRCCVVTMWAESFVEARLVKQREQLAGWERSLPSY